MAAGAKYLTCDMHGMSTSMQDAHCLGGVSAYEHGVLLHAPSRIAKAVLLDTFVGSHCSWQHQRSSLQ